MYRWSTEQKLCDVIVQYDGSVWRDKLFEMIYQEFKAQ